MIDQTELDGHRLLSAADIAKATGTCEKTIRRRHLRGKMPLPAIRIGNALRWRESDVRHLIGEK